LIVPAARRACQTIAECNAACQRPGLAPAMALPRGLNAGSLRKRAPGGQSRGLSGQSMLPKQRKRTKRVDGSRSVWWRMVARSAGQSLPPVPQMLAARASLERPDRHDTAGDRRVRHVQAPRAARSEAAQSLVAGARVSSRRMTTWRSSPGFVCLPVPHTWWH